VVDGVSWPILLGDLAAACAGQPLPAVGQSFRAWAHWLAGQHPDAAVWAPVVDGGHGLPVRREARPDVDRERDLRRTLVTRPATGVDAAVLLAGLATAVGGSVLVDVEGHGRTGGTGDLSRTVGWFTTVYPVRLDAGRSPAAALLDQVKQQTRPGRPIAPPGPSGAQIGFNFLGRAAGATGRLWEIEALGTEKVADLPVRHALEITAAVRDEQLTLSVAWLPAALDDAAVAALTERWLAALDGLAQPSGHVPADFPLLDLDQDQIEDLESEFATETTRE
jgi:non-ribosomal peptide synthase protein (TIGR01720 family)